MEIQLTPDQEAFVQKAIADGRISRPEEAVEKALAIWEEQERQRIEFLLSLREAEAELDRGEGILLEPHEIGRYFSDLKARARGEYEAEEKAV